MNAIRLSLLAIILLSGVTAMADTVEIKEWQVPYKESRPRDPYAESGESVWFVGQRAGYLANLNTKTGEFTKVDLKKRFLI